MLQITYSSSKKCEDTLYSTGPKIWPNHWWRSLLGRTGSCPPTFCSQWASYHVYL